MRKQAKLLANFLGATRELTNEYVDLAEITENEQQQIAFAVLKRADLEIVAKQMSEKGFKSREIADYSGWSHATVSRVLAKLKPGKAVSNETKAVSNETATTRPSDPDRARNDERTAEIAAAAGAEGVTPEPSFDEGPEEKYRIIYADPPWSYGDTTLVPHRRGLPAGDAREHYPSLELSEICALPVAQWTEDDAVLFLWATAPVMEEALQVVRAWGFTYKAQFIWDKIKHNMGHYNSVRHELLLICTRGSCQPDKQQLFDSVQSIERSKHSEKPIEFYDIIETLYTHGRKLEIFARGVREGWSVYGHVAELADAAE
jgi:N6-adenosine-specific RNA methylase IME4